MTEHEIQSAAIAQYRARGTSDSVLFAIPNGGLRNPIIAAKLKAEGVEPGAPDLFAAAKGSAHFIEVKTSKGRSSKAQQAMHRRIHAAVPSVPVIVCHGLDELLDWLEKTGILRPNRAFVMA